MSQYSYRARGEGGKEVRGKLRAPTEERAMFLLREHGLSVLEVRAVEKVSWLHHRVFAGRVDTADLILFTRQIAVMIRAGVPILQALQALAREVDKPAFRTLVQEVTYEVEGGESLSAALSKHPTVFSVFFLGVVKTGEASGQLSESLITLADYLEQNYIFTRKLRTALMYPAFILATVVIVAGLMFTFVVPQLVVLFEDAQVQLPLPTRILISVTHFLTNYWYVLGLIVVALIVVGRSYLKTPEGQYNLSTLVLRLPGLKRLFAKVYLARLTSILHTLFRSDVPVLKAFQLARESLSNRVYQTILDDTILAIQDGATISSIWEHEPNIPPVLTTMVSIGERSGTVDAAFKEAYAYFKRDVDEILASVATFIEPVIVIILGIGVGLIVAAVLLPIYNLVLVV